MSEEMQEIKKAVAQMAETCKDPNQFVSGIEELIIQSSFSRDNLYIGLEDILLNFGYFQLALRLCQHAMKYFVKNKDKARQAMCYTNSGNAYSHLGHFEKAIEFQEKALKIAEEIGDKDGKLRSYVNLGGSYHTLGDFEKAIEFQEKALKIAEEIGDKDGQARCYSNIGSGYYRLGHFEKAIEFQEKALKIAEEIGDKSGEAASYMNIGIAYRNMADIAKAIENYEKALKIAEEIGDRYQERICYANLGNAHLRSGQSEKAIENYKKALKIAEEIGDRVGQSASYSSIGVVYANLGVITKAIEFQEKALNIAEEIGDKTTQFLSNINLGHDHYKLGNSEKAIENYEKALNIAQRRDDINFKREINLHLGLFYQEDKPEIAYDFFKHSIDLAEATGGNLVEEEHKIGLYSLSSHIYQYMIPLCLRLGRRKEAFEYAERSKSKAFLDILADTEIRSSIKSASKLKPLLNQYEQQRAMLRENQVKPLKKTNHTSKISEADSILNKLDEVRNRIKKIDPEYASVRGGRPVALNEIQKMIPRSPGTVLVEYFVTEDKTFIFIATSHDLHIETVQLPQEKLVHFFNTYWREVVDYYGDQQYIGNTWQQLSSYLIEPISEYLSKAKMIYFVPHSHLHYIPLHALELNDRPLIESHAVVYLPSASILRFCKDKGSGSLKSCAAFGDAFKEEAEDVAKLFNTKPYLNPTRAVVIKNISNDILHFSCHGYFRYSDPMLSGIVLHDDILSAKELFNLKLNAELVTLSACQTGLNRIRPGDELMGLTRAFLYAGASSVVVSLWSVNAHSTQELMLEFYKQLKNKRKNKAAALQEAQKKIMQKQKYSHPYYWAPFMLVGDWE